MMDADEAYFKEHNEPLFSSHMIDLSEESKDDNISITKKYLQRAAPMKQWLEMVLILPCFILGIILTNIRKSVSLEERKMV